MMYIHEKDNWTEKYHNTKTQLTKKEPPYDDPCSFVDFPITLSNKFIDDFKKIIDFSNLFDFRNIIFGDTISFK